jgi:CelD/BcsL family acetyltransferase involved in cellulose biosynthesis
MLATIPLPNSRVDQGVEARAVEVTSLAGIEALRPLWGAFKVSDIDSDIDYFTAVVASADLGARPYVSHIRLEDGHDLLVVARIQQISLPLRVGYSVLGHVKLLALIVSFDGILGSRGRADEDVAFAHLQSALSKGEADIVIMRNIDVASDRYSVGVSSTLRLLRGFSPPPSRRWVADIPGSFDEFLSGRSSKTRNTLRRHDKALRAHYEGKIELRRFDQWHQMDEMCEAMRMVGSRSYQQGLGVAFSGSPLQMALISLGLKKGWARTWVLYLEGRPVSFWTGMAYGNTFYIGTPGFDPEFSKQSVGRFTMLRMLEDLCADPAISLLDFGQGEAEYKSAFGRCARRERELLLIAPKAGALLRMAAYSSLAALNNQGRRLVGHLGWTRSLRSMWRNRKAGTSSADRTDLT